METPIYSWKVESLLLYQVLFFDLSAEQVDPGSFMDGPARTT